TRGQRATGATRVNEELGITGAGTLIAGVDTGVEGTHPALASRWRGNVAPVAECWLDLLGSRPTPYDDNSHGTHTMGTMCGRGISGNDTITVGAAPEAQWIATNPINQGVGADFTQDVFDAFEWLTDPDNDPNTMDDVPDVIQNSWGVTSWMVGTRCYSNWNGVILNCEAAGPVVIWSAGNESSSGLRSPAIFELNPYQIFAVGAVDATNDTTPPYPIADFSSLGPSGCDPDPAAFKPDIAAPGVDVLSSVPGGRYEQQDWSGTSMSGPHVSGVVALMRQACPDCDYIAIKQALMSTAIDEGYPPDGDDNSFGAGFLNAYEAVLAVANLGRVDGYITDTDLAPLPGVRVEAMTTSLSTRSDSDGYYNLSCQQGVYSIRYSKFGYQTVTVPGVETFEGDTTRINVEMTPAPAGVLAGTVMLQSGIGVANARVAIQGTPLDTLFTDDAGRFVVELPATSYDVHVLFSINLVPPVLIEADTNLTIQTGDTTFADIVVFVAMVEPTNADAYGYRAYDRYDRDLPAPSEWIELDPLYGNPGEEFFFSHGDSAVYFPAPFPLTFYGQTWDTLTVNCNGWMLPGVHHISGRANTSIPYPLNDPPGIIAPFWDDLRESSAFGGQSFVYYDLPHGRWIFEFIYQRFESPPAPLLNWQVHILDPAFYPTPNGDNEIVFIYGRLDQTTGCTIGIESPQETTGIQVLFNGTLNENSWPVENGMAMRFTPGRPTETGSVAATVTTVPARGDVNGATLYAGGRVIAASGLGFADNSVAAGTVHALFVYDGYDAWRGQFALTPGGTATPGIVSYRLDPPRGLVAAQSEGVVTLQWHRPLSTETPPPYAMRYSVYRNGSLVSDLLADTTFVDAAQPHGATARYAVKAHYRYSASDFSDTLTVAIDLPAGEPSAQLPTEFRLYPNYPNPFNPATTIRFDVPEPTDARIEVFDVTGRLVRTLHSGVLSAGRHALVWNAADVSAGLYLCRVSSPRYTATQKMILLK
ncbi:MAG: S8 family serine peptidase, partial [bacterium]|nr:S8 family serine peptidase [bacterium]